MKCGKVWLRTTECLMHRRTTEGRRLAGTHSLLTLNREQSGIWRRMLGDGSASVSLASHWWDGQRATGESEPPSFKQSCPHGPESVDGYVCTTSAHHERQCDPVMSYLETRVKKKKVCLLWHTYSNLLFIQLHPLLHTLASLPEICQANRCTGKAVDSQPCLSKRLA